MHRVNSSKHNIAAAHFQPPPTTPPRTVKESLGRNSRTNFSSATLPSPSQLPRIWYALPRAPPKLRLY